MKYRSESDWRTGKCFFNPQQDMADCGRERYERSIRRCQDLMAFLYFSYFIDRKEKESISQVITGLENMRKILIPNIGYHPDREAHMPENADFQAFVRASEISKRHPILRRLYYLKQVLGKELIFGDTLSKQVMFWMKGRSHFQKWQELQGRSE